MPATHTPDVSFAAWLAEPLSPRDRLLWDLEELRDNLLSIEEGDDLGYILDCATYAERECARLLAEAPNTLFCGKPLGVLHGGCTNERKARTLHDGLWLALADINRAITGGGDADDRAGDIEDAAAVIADMYERLNCRTSA